MKRDMRNKLIEDFFNGRVSDNSDSTLRQMLDENEDIPGVDLVDLVSCFYTSLKEEGILS